MKPWLASCKTLGIEKQRAQNQQTNKPASGYRCELQSSRTRTADARHSRAPLTHVRRAEHSEVLSLARPRCMAESKVVHKREPNWALLVPILYAPLFPLMRIALKGNPRLPAILRRRPRCCSDTRRLRDVQRLDGMSFVGFAAFEAPSPDKQVVTREGLRRKGRELERACKQCGKKDASTKLKGLEALVARVSDVDATEVRAVAQWLRDARASWSCSGLKMTTRASARACLMLYKRALRPARRCGPSRRL